MYEYLNGTITEITPAYVVVECQGVGYKVYSPQPYSYEVGVQSKIFVEQIVRENEQTLYGFLTQDDKKLFLELLKVNGIGPKSAMAIMASENSDSLAAAIENGEVSFLTRFPGVGKKTASQIVLDLKGKLGSYVKRPAGDNPELEDAILALLSLGYTQKEVEKIREKLSNEELTTSDAYVKEGLRLLLKK